MLDSVSQKCGQWQTLCSTRGGWGRHRTRQPPSPPSLVPSVASPEVSKHLTQKHFSAIPQKTKPQPLCLVFCARLCLLHTSHGAQGQGTTSSSSSMVCSKRGDDMADPHHTSASAAGGRDPGQETCHHTMWLGQPQVSPGRRPALLGGVKSSELGLNMSHCAASL